MEKSGVGMVNNKIQGNTVMNGYMEGGVKIYCLYCCRKDLTIGVPQGSILESYLFIVFRNDISPL